MEKKSSLSPKHTFSFEAFKQKWKTADSQIKMNMIRFAGELDVEDSLEPIVLGLKEYARPVREEAKKSLEKLAHQIPLSRVDDKESLENKIRKMGRFTAVVYRELKLTKDLNLTELFFSTLLQVGGRGPALVWYFFSQGFVSENIMMEMIKRLTVCLQLILLHQYTLDRVRVRRQYSSLVRVLLEEIDDRDAIVSFLADLFDHDSPPDPLFANHFRCADIHTVIRENRLKSKSLEDRIAGMKAASILGYPDYRDAMIDLLDSSKPSEDRIEILKLLTKPNAPKNSDVVGKVWRLLEADEKIVVMHALNALVSLKASGLGKAASGIYRDDPSMREHIHRVLEALEWRELNIFFNALPPELAGAARSSVGHMIFEKNPDKLFQFLDYFASGDTPFKAEAKNLLKEVESIRKIEIDEICKQKAPKLLVPRKPKKKLFEKITQKKPKKRLSGANKPQIHQR